MKIEQTLLGQNKEEALIIKSEDEAWALLEKLQRDDFEAPDDLILNDWFRLEFHLQGDKFDSSITPSLFPVFHSLQRAINRSYADAHYGYKSARLTNEEKEKLEIIIRVTGGSSNLSSWFDLSQLGPDFLKKMTKKQVFILLLSTALLWGGTTAWRDYLENKKEARIEELRNAHEKQLLEHLQFASQQETKRMELMAEISQRNENVRSVYEESEKLQEEKLKAATKSVKAEISGVKLEQTVAEQLIKNTREKPEPTRIDGVFQVLKLDWDNPEFAQITLKRITDDLIVTATFNIKFFSDAEKETIKNAEWDEQGYKTLKANINARKSRGRIVDAELMRVEPTDLSDIEPAAR